MLLKLPMEDKKLNFNQPLLSARRYTPAVTSRRKTNNSQPVIIPRPPPHKSEVKSGPVTNAGAVPFLWEHTPGHPKEHVKTPTDNTSTDTPPPIAPRLPPGRFRKPVKHDCLTLHSTTTITIDNNNRQAVDIPSGPSHDECFKNIESGKKTKEEEKEISDSGDSDDAYVDALDTLSRTESFFLNCSTSGLSGLDDVYVKPSGSLSTTDLQAREFMMDRFLPAAKAMASETPQYATKKQLPAVQEHAQQLKKTLNHYKPSLRYGPSFAQRYSHYEEKEEEESDDEYDEGRNLPSVCGLLPRFCLRSSLCLLNPVPAMSVRTRVQIPSGNKVQSRSSLSGSSENESRSGRIEIKLVDKIQTAELDDDKTKSRRTKCGRLESHRTLTHGNASFPCPEEKKVIAFPELKMHAGSGGFGSDGNGFITFEELLTDQGSPKESNSGSHVIEKTLYVDTVQKVESPNLRSFSHDTDDNRENDHEIISKRMDQMDTTDSPLEDFNKLKKINGEEKLPTHAHKFGASSVFPLTDKSTEKCGMELPKAFAENQGFSPDSTITENIQVTEKEAMDGSENQLSRAIILGNSYPNYVRHPVPPPLPKSPSDSWLWRTLPSMATKSSSLHSYVSAATNPQNQCSKAPTSNIKWESIVKTTTGQRRRLHYSDDSLTTIPET